MYFCTNILLYIIFVILLIYLPIKNKVILLLLYSLYIHKTLRILSYFIIYSHSLKTNYKFIVSKIFTKYFKFTHNFENIPNHPTIFMANYPITELEYCIPSLIPSKICFITSKRAKRFLELVYEDKEYLVFDDKKKNNYEYLKKKIQNILKTNRSIYVYVEDQKQRIYDFHIGNMRKGIFYIAKELDATITPLVIDGVLTKHNIIPSQNFRIKIGETQKIINPKQSMYKVRNFLVKNKRVFYLSKFK